MLTHAPLERPLSGGDFYVTGGTLRPDAPSYVERQADKDLCQGLTAGEFCYVLTSRQMGKSSLMVRTVKRLREDGFAVAVLDLTAIGQNLTIEQWYDGLVSRLGQQLDLEDELSEFWETRGELGPLQRWLTSIEEVVLKEITDRVVIFVDEIDIVRSLPFSTDEFFAAIREAYNRRSREPAFARLAFGLLGVAAPTDLIRDTRMTPFNIGRRIELNDFTAAEAAPLARGLGPDEETAEVLLGRILHWTGGHPYLTQRLCRELAESVEQQGEPREGTPPLPPIIPTERTVDELAAELFLSRQARERDDNLVFVRERILRSEVDVAGLLYLYRRVLNRERVPDDETNPLVTVLRLAGVIRSVNGTLKVRNRVYAQVFDHAWIHTNMPEAEVRRQRSARRKGVGIGLAIAVVFLLGYLVAWPLVTKYWRARTAQRTASQVETAYRELTAYRDTFETMVEIAVGGVNVPVRGSGSILYHAPDKYALGLRSEFSVPETEVRISNDGRASAFYESNLRQFQIVPNRVLPAFLSLPSGLSDQVGPMRVLPLYRMFLDREALDAFSEVAHNVTYAGTGELNGQRVRMLQWQHDARPLLAGLGLTNNLERARIPVTIWVNHEDFRVLQIRLNLSEWARQLVGDTPEVNVTGLVLTETHRTVELSTEPVKPVRFNFMPGENASPVREFHFPSQETSTRAFLKKQFGRMIPSRFPGAPPNLIDLTPYYNAALNQPWHPGGNSLGSLETGLLQFGSTFFDVRGVVQLSGKQLERAKMRYPESILGIEVNQSCRELHFLHASGWRTRDGTEIGAYIIHYRGGLEQKVPIIYGEDVRDWNMASDPSGTLKRANLVWQGVNDEGLKVRLFKTSWVNPFPDLEISTIDYISHMADAAPFLIAITAEP